MRIKQIIHCKECGKVINEYSEYSEKYSEKYDCIKHLTCSECYKGFNPQGEEVYSHFNMLNREGDRSYNENHLVKKMNRLDPYLAYSYYSTMLDKL